MPRPAIHVHGITGWPGQPFPSSGPLRRASMPQDFSGQNAALLCSGAIGRQHVSIGPSAAIPRVYNAMVNYVASRGDLVQLSCFAMVPSGDEACASSPLAAPFYDARRNRANCHRWVGNRINGCQSALDPQARPTYIHLGAHAPTRAAEICFEPVDLSVGPCRLPDNQSLLLPHVEPHRYHTHFNRLSMLGHRNIGVVQAIAPVWGISLASRCGLSPLTRRVCAWLAGA
jgi:hypothetical protein